MVNKDLFKELLSEFSKLYWLKPVDIVWDAVVAYHIRNFISENDKIMDLGCGDGLFSAITFGASLPLEYDRFVSAIPASQKIGEKQSGDIYSNPQILSHLSKKPIRRIDVGLELKRHHIEVAESLGIYDRLIEADFKNILCEDKIFDKVYSAMAFYWGDDMSIQLREVNRILKNDGRFMATLTSEYMYDMHIARKLADDNGISMPFKNYLLELDGGRREFVTRHGRTSKEWTELMAKNGFEVIEIIPIVNEIMFMLQDISQRPFLKMFIRMAQKDDFKPFKTKVREYLCNEVYPELIEEMLKYEGNTKIRHGMYLITATKIKSL